MDKEQRDALDKIRIGILTVVDGLERLLELPIRTSELRAELKQMRKRERELEGLLEQTEGGA